nr:hypothetical protein CFP56_56928 [Quercus suber]
MIVRMMAYQQGADPVKRNVGVSKMLKARAGRYGPGQIVKVTRCSGSLNSLIKWKLYLALYRPAATTTNCVNRSKEIWKDEEENGRTVTDDGRIVASGHKQVGSKRWMAQPWPMVASASELCLVPTPT